MTYHIYITASQHTEDSNSQLVAAGKPDRVVTSIAEALEVLRTGMAEDNQREVVISLAPGVHSLSETAVLNRTDLPAESYRCTWRSAHPAEPA